MPILTPVPRCAGECRFVRVTGVLDPSRTRTCVALVCAPRGAVWPYGGERPSIGSLSQQRAGAGGSLIRGGREQPRRSRFGLVLPDGPGAVSETGRYTRETGVVAPLEATPAQTRWIRAGSRRVPGCGWVSGDLLNMTGQACARWPSGFRSRAVMHRPGAGYRVPGVSETADVRVDHRERYQDVGFRWLRLPRFEPWTCHLQHKQPLASSSVVRSLSPPAVRLLLKPRDFAACWGTQPREPRSTESSGALGVLERR